MLSIGLVLGAGGVAGTAFHIGTLAALSEATGWEPGTADLIIGTSAGSGVAATLRAGISAADHYARSQGRPIAEDRYVPREEVVLGPPAPVAGLAGLPGSGWLAGVAARLPAAPQLTVAAMAPRGGPRPALLTGWLPRGRIASAPLGDRIRAVLPGPTWPARPLWICAVRLCDGARVVFGRDDVEVGDVGRAVEASSAVPGRVAPVRIGGRSYVDGGAWSAINADLAAPLGFDLVVVASPLTGTATALGWSPDHVVRRTTARQLAREVAGIRRRGTPVLVFQPTPDDLAAMGPDLQDGSRAAEVARTARHSVLRHLDDGDVADRRRLLERAASP